MSVAFPHKETADFRLQSVQDLSALRASIVEQLSPRTVDDLEFLRSIDRIDSEDADTLETILALNFVIGDD